eukprot:GHUV01037986.1.p1 GENE.GHUV01037986.1~~GHUV01037986.1.p1  ORF type:complete len:145 (-),score=16.38 GHUV01037986.1:498-932(-)
MALSTLNATSPVPPATSRCCMPGKGLKLSTNLPAHTAEQQSGTNHYRGTGLSYCVHVSVFVCLITTAQILQRLGVWGIIVSITAVEPLVLLLDAASATGRAADGSAGQHLSAHGAQCRCSLSSVAHLSFHSLCRPPLIRSFIVS